MNEYLYEITKDLPDDEWYEIRKRKKKSHYNDYAEVEDELWNTQESLNVLDQQII